jgi:hypothetical protein
MNLKLLTHQNCLYSSPKYIHENSSQNEISSQNENSSQNEILFFMFENESDFPDIAQYPLIHIRLPDIILIDCPRAIYRLYIN